MTPQLAQPVDAGQPVSLEFEDLVRRHQAMVFSIAFHFLQDRSTAEELAQDVFLQLYRHLPGLQSPEHVTFWLRRVAAHRLPTENIIRAPEVRLRRSKCLVRSTGGQRYAAHRAAGLVRDHKRACKGRERAEASAD